MTVAPELIGTGVVALIQSLHTFGRLIARLEERRRTRDHARIEALEQQHRQREADDLKRWQLAFEQALGELRREIADMPSVMASKFQKRWGDFELAVEDRLKRIEELAARFDERIQSSKVNIEEIKRSIERRRRG